jgi:hypothetical protein
MNNLLGNLALEAGGTGTGLSSLMGYIDIYIEQIFGWDLSHYLRNVIEPQRCSMNGSFLI